MLQDNQSVRHYQRLTDAMVDMWHKGYRFDEIRLYIEGYICCLRHTSAIESYLIHDLEEKALRFLHDPSHFALSMPQTQTETDYY